MCVTRVCVRCEVCVSVCACICVCVCNAIHGSMCVYVSVSNVDLYVLSMEGHSLSD